jgi:S1-C subfamily serine protease
MRSAKMGLCEDPTDALNFAWNRSVLIQGQMRQRAASTEQESRPPADSLLRGMQLASLTYHLRRRLALPSDINGVAIVDLADSSLAARVGLQRGDIIEQVERRDVSSADEVDRLMQRAAVAGRSSVLLLIRRGNTEVYMAVRSAKTTESGDPLLYRFAERCT